jgi:carboxypeptidase Q
LVSHEPNEGFAHEPPSRLPALTLLAASLLLGARMPPRPGNDPAALAKIRDAALQSDYAYQRLADLTDLIGPRLSGSPARRRR